jgi:hypothetical protein
MMKQKGYSCSIFFFKTGSGYVAQAGLKNHNPPASSARIIGMHHHTWFKGYYSIEGFPHTGPWTNYSPYIISGTVQQLCDVGICPTLQIRGKGDVSRVTAAECQWLTLVILATQEAEISRIGVRSQPRQIVHKTLSRKYPSQNGWRSGSRCRP